MISRLTRPEELPEFLTVPEVAAWLNATAATIYAMITRGDLKAVRVGRLVRIPRATLLAISEGRDQ